VQLHTVLFSTRMSSGLLIVAIQNLLSSRQIEWTRLDAQILEGFCISGQRTYLCQNGGDLKMRNMLHVIVKDGRVYEIIELGKWAWSRHRVLELEGEYKVEYYHTCTHKTEEEHHAECWRI
jgi:hypothetical protein